MSLPVSTDPDGAADRSEEDALETVARLAPRHGLWVATAESLTSGRVASRLGAGEGAASWLRGGVVAYDESVKFEVLGVEPGPLVTDRCATQMAAGTARLLEADAVVSLTGVGGPDPDEGHPPGTVVMAVRVGERTACETYHFDGEPDEVLEQATDQAVALLASTIADHVSRHASG
jgi:nicotinamide-nucleotide amidase